MDDKAIALASLQATVDSARWAYWSMIGTWLSGVATLLAVILSLYLANRRIKPLINADVSWTYIQNAVIRKGGIGITISNASQVNAVVKSIIWETGGKKRLAQMFGDAISQPMPTKIEGGHSAFYFIEADEGWLRKFRRDVLETGGSIKKLTMCVNLASGDKKRFKAKELSASLLSLKD
ncbi:hypothetical protein [Pantoea ananatis]|uniref:hypothetical protein n=1 Tax=Pantoea ananas TaxID=553 RepID=UPI0024486353|nr:hypothetical protein [Pantoea ananatis]MDH0055736.1 hypothetical protein [Pantoea ananatis]